MPRIIAGRYRGHPLQTPSGMATRPTADRTKEALFSALGDRVVDAQFLDCCAGSGSIGLEALSRGAAFVDLVESDRRALTVIRQNMNKLGASDDQVVLHPKSLARALPGLRVRLDQRGVLGYDLIYLDPPYREGRRIGRTLATGIAELGLLAPHGRLIQETDAHDQPFDYEAYGLTLMDSRRYGQTMLHTYTLAASSDDTP